jgi:hypothetical protein
MKVFVFMNLTLDGVMQSPALPEEDARGGFKFGGWGDPTMRCLKRVPWQTWEACW